MKRHRDFFQTPDEERNSQPLRRADEALVSAIIEEAQRQGVELTADRELLATLASIDSEAQIPRELYAAMAVVLSWMDGLSGEVAEVAGKPAAGKIT